MRSFARKSFWEAYRRLPDHVRRQARESYRFFVLDPRHPSLGFKRVSRRSPVYSVHVSNRAIAPGDSLPRLGYGMSAAITRCRTGINTAAPPNTARIHRV